jgi:DNA repair protein RecN (Recombination protein N)
MLENIIIRNIAVIDHAEIPFEAGLNILSGETGAGKSIVLEAISLILGSRANTDLIRAGCEEASVEGLFNIGSIDWIRPRLESFGIPVDSNELLIKRTIHSSGRHRIWINGTMANLSTLQEICEGLVDLCGQHEHQSLLKTTTQLDLLDRYGGLTAEAGQYREAFSKWTEARTELAKLQSEENERQKRADFLGFQIKELRDADLQAGEDETLAQEKQLLQSAESRVQSAEAVRRTLEDEDTGTLQSLRTCVNRLRQLSSLDERANPLREGLERALNEAEEVSLSLNRYLHSNDLDPSRLTEVQERLSLLADLRRKYGATVSDMVESLEKLENESHQIAQASDRLDELQTLVGQLEGQVRALGNALSKARIKASKIFSDSVTGELSDLKMGEALFSIGLEPREPITDWNAGGADFIQYLVQTNRGDTARPIGKIASGGELSRLMLAIRRVISDKGGIGVYLFDEVDSGVGGQTAFEVGRKLKSVARFNQVICITHIPQVASFADHHLTVRKMVVGKRTVTQVVPLNEAERKQEIARMLGGPQLTKKSLENAAELLEMALN